MVELFKISIQKDPDRKWFDIGDQNQVSIKTSFGQFDIFVLDGVLKMAAELKTKPFDKHYFIDINKDAEIKIR